MSIFSSVGKAIGKALNNITGASSAAKQNQQYALESAAINQKYALEAMQENNRYQKEFAQNGHQWEIEDLKKAGLNPVLSAGGGASASGGGIATGSANSASIASSGINPIETAIGAWNGFEQAQNTGADTDRKKAEIENLKAETILKHYETLTEMGKAPLNKAQKELIQTEKRKLEKIMGLEMDRIKAETKFTNERARGKQRSYAGQASGLWGGVAGGGSYSYTD